MPSNSDLVNRSWVIRALVVVVIVLYIVRLYNLQVVDDTYKIKANDNAFLTQIIYPSRGIIYDREGRELVYNQPAYDLLVTMRNVKNLDTLDFCRTLGIEREVFDRRMNEIRDRRRNPGYSSYTQQVFSSQLTGETFARMQEAMKKPVKKSRWELKMEELQKQQQQMLKQQQQQQKRK